MKKSLFIILLVSCIMSCSEKSFHYTSSPSGIEFILNGVKKRLTFYNQSIVRVSVAKENDSFTDSRLVVVLSPPNVHFTVEESDDLTLKTDSLTLKINKQYGSIHFYNSQDQLYVMEEEALPSLLPDTTTSSGSNYRIRQGFKLTDQEGIYA